MNHVSRSPLHWPVFAFAWALPVVLVLLRRFTVPDPSGLATHEQLGLAPCRFRALFGVPCPGCGVTTAVSHLSHGHPLLALEAQPLGFVIGVLALLLPLVATLRVVRGADLGADVARAARPRLAVVAAALVLAAWAYQLLRA